MIPAVPVPVPVPILIWYTSPSMTLKSMRQTTTLARTEWDSGTVGHHPENKNK